MMQPQSLASCSLDCEDGNRSVKQADGTGNQRQLWKLGMRFSVVVTLGAMMGTLCFFAVQQKMTMVPISKDTFTALDIACVEHHRGAYNGGLRLAAAIAECELPSPSSSSGGGSLAKFAMIANPIARSARLPSPPVYPVPSSGQRIASIQMAEVTTDMLKELRKETQAGWMDCKRALAESDGDIEKAKAALRAKGLVTAEKKASRTAAQGIIATYMHGGSQLGVMIEINCETDFVAKNAVFKELAQEIAMQIAAAPWVEVVSEADIPAALVEKERKIEFASEDLKGKPEDIKNKIVEGRVQKAMKKKILLEQEYFKDSTLTVEAFIKGYIAKLGENIQVRRFARFNVGGESDTESEEAEAVAA